MKKTVVAILLSLVLIFAAFAEGRDFASEVKLNMSSDSLKQVVTVASFVDGDTTHFNVPTSVSSNGILKARYLAINTPESTGKIEEYGKKASNFTRERLSKATSIIIESDNGTWNIDSTGGRYLVWVWYRTSETEPYRNLNIEILQNGLAIASSTANNRYGNVASAALSYAKEQKLNIYSGEKDPDFYYGEAVEMTLKELRCNVASYNGIKVAFEGVITMNDGSSIYIEDYDPDTNLYYGISVFYGYGLPGKGLEILAVGNRSRIVGTVQYYENGGVYQVSGLTYKQMKPKDPGNIQKISSGHSAAYVQTSAKDLVSGKVNVETSSGIKTFDYGYLALDTSVQMQNLEVRDIYTTSDPDSSSFGAMTMTCVCEGQTITVRTAVLTDDSRKLITADAYMGKTINVKGIVDSYGGTYQIKVLSAKDITIVK
ncbi:MAG: thermonuclease family protein [Sphaerochaetaceae bacterium]|nr:thermonuclease family protein [Sphaerochaetaceae bacterium]